MKLLKMSSSSGNLLKDAQPESSSSPGKPDPMKEFEILKVLSKGQFSRILLAKKKNEKMVLKAVQCDRIHADGFQRELDTTYYLSPHPHILTSYNVSFLWKGSYVFVQEFAPYGDLRRHLRRKAPAGLRDETTGKLVLKQISSALDFMHSSPGLVHGNLCPENILIFSPDLSLVKLCDFGAVQPAESLVARAQDSGPSPFLCPEVTERLAQEKYYVRPALDVWAFGILLTYCLTGSCPWGTADITDSAYSGYCDWQRRKSVRMPEAFKAFTPRLLRLLKRLLEPKPSKRCEVKEVFKYLKDEWLEKGSCPLSASKTSLLSRKDSSNSGTSGDRVGFVRQRSVSTSPGVTARNSSQKHARAKSLKAVKFNFEAKRKPSDGMMGVEGTVKRSVSYVK